jgi:hypothetical protein
VVHADQRMEIRRCRLAPEPHPVDPHRRLERLPVGTRRGSSSVIPSRRIVWPDSIRGCSGSRAARARRYRACSPLSRAMPPHRSARASATRADPRRRNSRAAAPAARNPAMPRDKSGPAATGPDRAIPSPARTRAAAGRAGARNPNGGIRSAGTRSMEPRQAFDVERVGEKSNAVRPASWAPRPASQQVRRWWGCRGQVQQIPEGRSGSASRTPGRARSRGSSISASNSQAPARSRPGLHGRLGVPDAA